MAGASIAGVQSAGIVSTIKHFVLNAQETGRTIADARIGEADLRMSDLLAFQIAIGQGRPGSVMCAYNKVGGDWACENRHLLTDVLKRDWGYRGWVMSDWGAVHSPAKAANVSFEVVNTGRRAGADVPQMYVSREGGRAPMRLAAFHRVTLGPGEACRITLTAEPRIIADYDTGLPGWRITGGRYRVALARDAQNRTLMRTAELAPATIKP